MNYYRTKSVVIEATKLTTDIILRDGDERGQVGDWFVIGVDGQPIIMPEEEFLRSFEPCKGNPIPTRFQTEKPKPDRKPRAKKGGMKGSVLGEQNESINQ